MKVDVNIIKLPDSVDDKSHLLVDADTVEPIEEYHSQWSID